MTDEMCEPKEVSIRMGDLEVTAQGETIEEAEETAERLFENRLDEVAEMTEAVKTVTRGYR